MTPLNQFGGPVPPTQGPPAKAAGGSPPPAAEGEFSQSYERMWALMACFAAGMAIAGIFLLLAWRPFVDLLVRVLVS